VRRRLEETGLEVLPITQQQVADFAGKVIKLSTPNGRVLALSARAAACLISGQRRAIEASSRLLPLHVPTIELAGGSVRCMLAGVHLHVEMCRLTQSACAAATTPHHLLS